MGLRQGWASIAEGEKRQIGEFVTTVKHAPDGLMGGLMN